jgi:hypothetical protein
MEAAVLAISAASSVASGISGMQAAKGEQQRAEANSYIGRTRAIQTDTASRNGLESELAAIRTVFGANQQKPNVGVMDMLNEIRTIRDRDRRIEVSNRMSEASDWRLAGKNAGKQATGALWSGIGRAAPSMFDFYQAVK